MRELPTYRFTLELEGAAPSDEELSRLAERGCADVLFGVSDGVVFADFERTADNYGAAVGQAIQDVEGAPPAVRVARMIRHAEPLSAAG